MSSVRALHAMLSNFGKSGPKLADLCGCPVPDFKSPQPVAKLRVHGTDVGLCGAPKCDNLYVHVSAKCSRFTACQVNVEVTSAKRANKWCI